MPPCDSGPIKLAKALDPHHDGFRDFNNTGPMVADEQADK
jgi:hypothetical protein